MQQLYQRDSTVNGYGKGNPAKGDSNGRGGYTRGQQRSSNFLRQMETEEYPGSTVDAREWQQSAPYQNAVYDRPVKEIFDDSVSVGTSSQTHTYQQNQGNEEL